MRRLILLVSMLLSFSLAAIASAQIEEPVQQTEDYALFVTIKIKPGKVVEYKKALLPYLEKVRAETGIQAYKVHQSAEDPSLFEIYAHFTSKAAHESHLKQVHTREYLAVATPTFEVGYPVRRKVFEIR